MAAIKKKMTFTLGPITLLAATWAGVGAAQAGQSTSRSMTVSVASAGSSGAVPSVKELEEYVRGTVSVRAEKVAYDPTHWKGGRLALSCGHTLQRRSMSLTLKAPRRA